MTGCGSGAHGSALFVLKGGIPGHGGIALIQRNESSQLSARSALATCTRESVGCRDAIRSASTRSASTSAATKLRSFSRKAGSFATKRNSLSKHQPVQHGAPEGRRSVGVLHRDQTPVPTLGQYCRLRVDAVDAETVKLLER